MSEFEKRSDQAGNLRTKMIDEYKQVHGDYPPRSEIHKENEKKTKLKMKYPVISLLALFFILLPIVILSVTLFYFKDGNQPTIGNQSSGNETVFISNEQQTAEEQDFEQEEIESDEEEEEANSSEQMQVKENDENQKNETETSKKQTNKETNEEYREVKTHTVAAGETLFSIAIKYYNSRSGEEIIRQYNGIDANNIYVGQSLKIPLK